MGEKYRLGLQLSWLIEEQSSGYTKGYWRIYVAQGYTSVMGEYSSGHTLEGQLENSAQGYTPVE
jgi:hypothetical protein